MSLTPIAALVLSTLSPSPRWEPGPILTLPPHFQLIVRERTGEVAVGVALPWSAQFGDAVGGERFRPHRLILEPSVGVSRRITFSARIGYQYVWHPAGRRLGLGVGQGVSFDLSEMRSALSPEVVLHVGRCCAPGYSIVSLRCDYAGGSERAWSFAVGTSFF